MRRVSPLGVLTLAAVLAFLATTERSAAQQGRALVLEDYYAISDVGSPQISPNGDWVAYMVSSPVEATNGSTSEAWVARTDGSAAPQRVTHEGAQVEGRGWTEDNRVRYVTPDGATWLVDPSEPAGPAERDESRGVEGVASPDGRWLAVTREMPLPPAPEPSLTDFEKRHAERFEGVQFDWYPFVRDGQSFPLPDRRNPAPEEIFLQRADGSGDARQLTRLGLQASSVSWRADGSELLFTADEAVLDELAYSRNDLFTVTVDGEVTRLTDDGYTYSGIGYSPDGRWITYVRAYGTDFIIDRKLDHGGPRDLYVRPAEGGQAVNLTADFDLDAGSPRWSPDSQHIYFTTGIGGATHLFRVSTDGRPVEQITHGDRRLLGLDIDASFRRIAYRLSEFERPSDIWTADIDGRNERRITDLHGGVLREVVTADAELVRYQSYDGTPIEGYLHYPYGYQPGGGPYPLIVVNHGGPHAASGPGFNFKNQFFAANGYFVFLPNFRSSTGYGDDFKWATWGAWGTLDGEDVLAGVDHLIEELPVDADRVGTTGHSYGGILTNWLITRYPDRFAAAVSGAGASNWTSNYAHSDVARTKEMEFYGRPWEPRAQEVMIRQSPYLNSSGVRTPTLFVHGEVDYRVPLEGAIQLYTSLKKQRVPAELIVYDGQAHGIRGHWNAIHRMMNELRWWETYLRPAPPVLTSDRR